jgi:hypothetical protein
MMQQNNISRLFNNHAQIVPGQVFSYFIFLTSLKVRTLLENTFENTVTVIVRRK